MTKIMNVESVFDNGEIWPNDTPVFPEIAARGATKMVLKRWLFEGHCFELAMIGMNAYEVIELLTDETGFLGMKHYDVTEAHILNGDASIRFLLKPAVNMRGFDAERLASIEKTNIEKAKLQGNPITSCQPSGLFHYKTARKDVLEIFGDDGFGDCFYRYDTNTGELISYEPRKWRS